jgi:hypothetical protein
MHQQTCVCVCVCVCVRVCVRVCVCARVLKTSHGYHHQDEWLTHDNRVSHLLYSSSRCSSPCRTSNGFSLSITIRSNTPPSSPLSPSPMRKKSTGGAALPAAIHNSHDDHDTVSATRERVS